MKKILIILFCTFILLWSCSCTRVVENSADEIKMNKWIFVNENYPQVLLDFKEDRGKLKIVSKDKYISTCIEGLCVIDKNNILIYNEKDKQNYIFNYTLKNDKLTLSYCNGKLILTRKK